MSKPRHFLLSLFIGFLLLSAHSVARTPVSVTFHSEGVTEDGEAYRIFVVRCKTSGRIPLTAWSDNQWCVGEESRENCFKKQWDAAKAACSL